MVANSWSACLPRSPVRHILPDHRRRAHLLRAVLWTGKCLCAPLVGKGIAWPPVWAHQDE
eukprot:scaffold259025_cov34-Tisochrysis_lutea.AAC.4